MPSTGTFGTDNVVNSDRIGGTPAMNRRHGVDGAGKIDVVGEPSVNEFSSAHAVAHDVGDVLLAHREADRCDLRLRATIACPTGSDGRRAVRLHAETLRRPIFPTDGPQRECRARQSGRTVVHLCERAPDGKPSARKPPQGGLAWSLTSWSGRQRWKGSEEAVDSFDSAVRRQGADVETFEKQLIIPVNVPRIAISVVVSVDAAGESDPGGRKLSVEALDVALHGSTTYVEVTRVDEKDVIGDGGCQQLERTVEISFVPHLEVGLEHGGHIGHTCRI